jgi:Big-like domain-containing protein
VLVSSPARLLSVLALLGAGLALVAPSTSAVADDPYPYPFLDADHDEIITLLDVPGYASSLVTRGGEASWLSGTLNSTVAQEYGLTAARATDISDTLRSTWVDDQDYPHLSGSALAGADSVALGYLTNDAQELSAAYLIKRTGGADDRIQVFGPQSRGFEGYNQIDVSPGVLSLTVTEPAAGQPAYIFLRYADHLGAVSVSADGDLIPVTVTGAPTGVQLDLYHRGTWLDQGSAKNTALDERKRAFAVLTDNGGTPDRLQARMLTVAGHTATSVNVSATTYSQVHELASSGTRSWLPTGQVRYAFAGGTESIFANNGDPQYFLALTGRDAAADGGQERNHLLASLKGSANVVDSLSDGDGSTCGGDTALAIDVESYHADSLVGCASVDINGNADRLVQNMGRIHYISGATRTSWLGQHSNAVNDEDRLGQLNPRIVLPCATLMAAKGHSCSIGATAPGDGAGNAALQTTLAGDVDTSSSDPTFRYQYQVGDAWLDQVKPASTGAAGTFLWTKLADDGAVGANAPLLVAPFPITANEVDVHVPDRTPVLTRSRPIPVAFLAAPPQVSGAGQQGDAPEFASTSGSSNGTSTSTSSRIGVHVGMEYEDPLGANGVAIEAALESEVSDDTSIERTVTTSQAFRGLEDQDVVVYRTVPTVQWRGEVVHSSTGVGAGTATSIDFPTANVVTSAASVSSLARSYPDLFGPTGQLKPVLDQVFNHDVGDPGSYMKYGTDGAAVDGYCDGSLGSGGDRELRTLDTLVPGNPFLTDQPDPPRPDILVSAQHDVQTGTGNSEGATFSIENSTTNSRVQTTSLDVSVTGKAGYIQGGVSGGYTWGTGWSSTISDGAEFASFVGHIPSENPAFDSETYSWRSFLCQKTMGDTVGAPITAWVLDYAVDDYAGSGGLAPLAPVQAVGPAQSTTTDPKATVLKWQQDSGTVETYDWRLEAVGVHDVRSGSVGFDTPKDSKSQNTPTHAVPVTGTALLPGQLYRWRVVATDFFDNSTSSDWEYFVTSKPAEPPAPPAAPTAVDDRVSALEDRGVNVDVTANDVNPAHGALALAIVDDAVHGTATVQGGALHYEPKRNFCGLDSFDYAIADAAGRPSTATAMVRVRCVNDAPVAQNDRVRMPRDDRTLTLLAPGPLGNDIDAEHDDLIPKLVRVPQDVDVELGERGALIVTLGADVRRTGTLRLKYRACDEEACSDVATITLVL